MLTWRGLGVDSQISLEWSLGQLLAYEGSAEGQRVAKSIGHLFLECIAILVWQGSRGSIKSYGRVERTGWRRCKIRMDMNHATCVSLPVEGRLEVESMIACRVLDPGPGEKTWSGSVVAERDRKSVV